MPSLTPYSIIPQLLKGAIDNFSEEFAFNKEFISNVNTFMLLALYEYKIYSKFNFFIISISSIYVTFLIYDGQTQNDLLINEFFTKFKRYINRYYPNLRTEIQECIQLINSVINAQNSETDEELEEIVSNENDEFNFRANNIKLDDSQMINYLSQSFSQIEIKGIIPISHRNQIENKENIQSTNHNYNTPEDHQNQTFLKQKRSSSNNI